MKLFLTVSAILIFVSGGASQIVSRISAEDVCYGDTVQVSCLVRDISSYAIAIPQWNQNDNLLAPNAINLEVLHYNATAYALSVMVTRELFTGSSLAYSCFLLRPNGDIDMSEDQVISPLERPKSPELRNVSFSHDSATISWTHNPVCYSNCTFLFNVTLHQAVQPNKTLSVDGTITDENNVTFEMLSVDVIYQAMITAYCMEEPNLSSEPLEVKFNGTQFNTPTDGTSPTTTATTNPPTIPTEIATLSTGAIVGIAIATAVVVCLLIAVIVVVVLFIVKRPKSKSDGDRERKEEKLEVVCGDEGQEQVGEGDEQFKRFDLHVKKESTRTPAFTEYSELKESMRTPAFTEYSELKESTRTPAFTEYSELETRLQRGTAQLCALEVRKGDEQFKRYDLHFQKLEDRSCWVHVKMEQNFDDERTICRRIIEALEREGFAVTT